MLPRVLIFDDLFGRNISGGRNPDRENLCAHFLLHDVTGDAAALNSQQKVLKPVAMATFGRGQTPADADVGAVVENDLPGALASVRAGWLRALADGEVPWAMVLLDLCFYTGLVTAESNRRNRGMAEGRPGDDDPTSYFGLKLLEAIHHEFPELPIFILSSKPREEVSLGFTRRGALGFIARDDPRGPTPIHEALWQHGLLPDRMGCVIGYSLPVLLCLREARQAARHRGNLLIRGERGTGKDLLARYVCAVGHGSSSLRDPLPFIAVNSAVLRTDLFAAELFGIEPKTASGVDGKIGLVEAADGGDLFFDEIADMAPETQAAVLRVLQDRHVARVGARHAKVVDVRFLSATNVDLEDPDRGFRADLLDRLRLGGTLWLPPLRDRMTDILLLAEYFVREAENERPGTMPRQITQEATQRLLAYDWPGNIRELRTILFDAVYRNPDVEHLVPDHLRLGRPQGTPSQSTANSKDRFSLSQLTIGEFRSGCAAASLQKATPLANSSSSVGAVNDVNTSGLSGGAHLGTHLSDLIDIQSRILFDSQEIAEWSGRLTELQHAHYWLLARYLLSAIEATKRRTHQNPEGLIQIHPAVKLITGDPTLTASTAADVIKRLLSPLDNEINGDLREALEIALRLRPRSGKK